MATKTKADKPDKADKPAKSAKTQETDTTEQPRFRLNLRHISLVLVLIGILISGYLSFTELTQTAVICAEGDSFSCDAVQSSVYSKFMGVPIAYLGLATYLALGALLLFENRVGLLKDYGPMLVFGITLFAFMFSLWLIYVQAVIMGGTYCSWCLGHELTMTALFVVSIFRLRNALMSGE